MATLTASGIGSGLDINNLLQQIVAAERAPTESRLNLKEAEIQAKLSAYGTMNGAVSSFQSSVSKLKTQSGFSTKSVSVSNTDALSASVSSIADAGTYSVKVNTLAQPHVLASVAFADLDTVIGSGTLSFDFGTTVYDPGTDFVTGDDTYTSFTANTELDSASIVLDNTNNTVEGVRDAINQANIGVRASIVNDGDGYRLLLTAASQGEQNGLRISVDEGGAAPLNIDSSGLSQLAFNNSATNMEQTQAAQDANLSVNGLNISRETNQIGDAIRGVSLNLLDADPAVTVQLKISADTASVEKNISSFVTAYNDLLKTFQGFTEYHPDTSSGSILTGDATTRTLMSQIRRTVGTVLQNGAEYTSLSSIGITTSRDGSLALNSAALHDAVLANADAVAALFHTMGTTTDSAVSFVSSTTVTREDSYRVNISTLATQGSLAAENVSGPIIINALNNTFSAVVDGRSAGLLSLTQATYNDMNDLAEEIANRINGSSVLQSAGKGVNVRYVSNHFVIESLSYGSASSVSFGATLNASLGFTSNAINTTGVDVEGSIGSAPGSGVGQYLTGAGDASGLKLQISGTELGNRGTVHYSTGLAGSLDALVAAFLAKTGQLTAKTDSLKNQVQDIAEQRKKLDARVTAVEERYRSQFIAMDALVAQLQSTGNYLQQQIDSLPEINVK